ncbi:MAG: hypothetical protein AVDCRST_MAG96-4254, partial [uncultured Segetibacter sp.]
AKKKIEEEKTISLTQYSWSIFYFFHLIK